MNIISQTAVARTFQAIYWKFVNNILGNCIHKLIFHEHINLHKNNNLGINILWGIIFKYTIELPLYIVLEVSTSPVDQMIAAPHPRLQMQTHTPSTLHWQRCSKKISRVVKFRLFRFRSLRNLINKWHLHLWYYHSWLPRQCRSLRDQ